MPKVVNVKHSKYDVYIGRSVVLGGAAFPKGWGNPYSVEAYGRDGCIERFKRRLWEEIKNDRTMVDRLRSLDGKLLGCHCKPRSCHGDVIASAVEWAKEQ